MKKNRLLPQRQQLSASLFPERPRRPIAAGRSLKKTGIRTAWSIPCSKSSMKADF